MGDIGINEYPYLEQAAVLILIFKLARHKYLEFHFNKQKTRHLVPRVPRDEFDPGLHQSVGLD